MATLRTLFTLSAGTLVVSGAIPCQSAAQRPTSVTAPVLVPQLGHAGALRGVAFSPDGRHVLTGAEDDDAVLWEVASGAEVRRFEGHRDDVSSVAFSPDGRRALTGSADSTAALWDVATGAELVRFRFSTTITSVAFSPDGRRVLTGSERQSMEEEVEQGAVLWDAESGAELRRFGDVGVTSVAFSPNGRRILTGSYDAAVLWDAETGAELNRFQARGQTRFVGFSSDGTRVMTGNPVMGYLVVRDVETGAVLGSVEEDPGSFTSLVFSADGATALTGSRNGTVGLWDVESGDQIRRYPGGGGYVYSLAVSRDGRQVLAGTGADLAQLWELESGAALRRFEGLADGVRSLAFTPDGQRLGVVSGSKVHLWDLESGHVSGLSGLAEEEYLVTASSDGQYLITGRRDDSGVGFNVGAQMRPYHTAVLRDGESGRELLRLEKLEGQVFTGTLSNSRKRAIVVTIDPLRGRQAVLWNLESGSEVRRFEPGWAEPTLSEDDQLVLSADGDGHARLLDAATGELLQRFEVRDAPSFGLSLISVALSADGGRVLGGLWSGEAVLWDVESGDEIRRLEGHSQGVGAVAFAPGGRRAVTGSGDGTAILWNLETGAALHHLGGHTVEIRTLAFSPDGTRLVTGSRDGMVRLWDAQSGEPLATLFSLPQGTWAAIDPAGRFDTNDLEQIRGLSWVMPDDPLTPLPLETFMRDYYEPRLLPRLLAGERLPELGRLQELNRVQPEVRLESVEPQPDGTATVTVRVEGREREYGGRTHASGAQDLHLFRDGQLVALERGDLLDAGVGATRTFGGIQLPAGRDSVTFSAYSFNTDGVKSRTVYRGRTLPERPELRRRAYVVSLGVNTFADPRYDLRFAANDARLYQKALAERLEATGRYEEVVVVPLISDTESSTLATRAAVRAVFTLLAGEAVAPGMLAAIPNAERIRRATPDDLLVFTAATHGFTAAGGTFHLFPADIATADGLTAELLASTISSADLSAWLLPVDAGRIVAVVDACHSAAAVAAPGFKPGPMGSRGLGQLAFNKGMQLLAASQADDVALESESLRQGLLTYALVRDGLEAGAADHDPEDAVISLGEWLAYGVRRVPVLYEEMRSGEITDPGTGGTARAAIVGEGAQRGFELGELQQGHFLQQPSLFDFNQRPPLVLDELR